MASDNKPCASTSFTTQYKKRKAENIFDILSDYENLSEEEILNQVKTSRQPKIPPVVVYSNISTNIIEQIKKNSKSEVYVKYRGNRSNIYANNLGDYNSILKFAKEKKVDHYTFTPSECKEVKMVLKNISPHITADEIKNDLENKNFKVVRVLQMIKKCENDIERKLPLFVITFEAGTDKRSIFKTKYVCSCVIEWAFYKSKSQILQCFRCQGYNHTSKNCFKQAKCLKCAGEHFTSQCSVVNREDYKCANCKKNHMSNDPCCEIKNKVLQTRLVRNQQRQIFAKNFQNNQTSVPRVDNKSYPPLRQIQVIPQNIVNENNFAGRTSTNINNDVNISDFILEIKNLFTSINLNKIRLIISDVSNKLKGATNTMDKMFVLAAGLCEMLNDG